VRLASCALLPLNDRGEAQRPYNLIRRPKADDRVGKSIDSTANSQSGRVAELTLSMAGLDEPHGIAMIKTGLYRLEQLSSSAKTRGFFGGTRRVSVTLYEKLDGMKEAQEWAEQILFSYCDARGIYKRTYACRFDQFDDMAIDRLGQAFPASRTLTMHDIGVSDARTACDLFHKLAARFPHLNYYASDYEPSLMMLRSGKGRTVVTLNKKGEAIEIVVPPFVFNLIKPENFLLYPVNYVVFLFARATVLRRALAKYRAGKIKPSPLVLFCPAARDLAASDSRFHLLEYDLLKPHTLPCRVDVVRVMNVLNSSYFDPQQLSIAVGHIFESLAIGGLLIVGSNDAAGSEVRGGIYRKLSQGFQELAKSGADHDAHRTIVGFAATQRDGV